MRRLQKFLRKASPTSKARSYLAAQAGAGAVWWVAVFASEAVRRWTLGEWDPRIVVGPDTVLFVGASAIAAALGSRAWATVVAAWSVAMTAALTISALIERRAGAGVVLMILATIGTLAATLTMWTGRLPVQWFFVGPFRFRVATTRGGRTNLRRSLVQLVFFWSTFLILIPLSLAWFERRLYLDVPLLSTSGWGWAGVVVITLGSTIGLWACLSMALRGDGTPLPSATARNLVVVGPYRVVRNPMVVTGALQTIGVGFVVGSWMVLVSSIVGALLWNTFIRPDEEADLAARFGRDYDDYRTIVRCWVPAMSSRSTINGPRR